MPATIVTTIGSASANSYISEADARSYFDDRLDGRPFIEASSDDQQRVLLMAAARLNDTQWAGVRASASQSLAWPRIGVVKRDTVAFSAILDQWASDEIPQFVKDAQCLLALSYLQGYEEGAPRITKLSQDGLTLEREYAQPVGVLPAAVLRLISPYLMGTSKVRA